MWHWSRRSPTHWPSSKREHPRRPHIHSCGKSKGYLRQQRKEIDETFDYRYSQLPFVFARLIRQGHLDESLLVGLSEEKREIIRSFLGFAAR
jgi:hypothetical protein